jgi:hypothetical protein
MRVIFIVGLAALAACSKSGATGPSATPGALVIKILSTTNGGPGCLTFDPQFTTAPFTQQVQWLNTTSDTVSVEQFGSIVTSAAPGQYTPAGTIFSVPGVFQYGSASCADGGPLDGGYSAQITFTNP